MADVSGKSLGPLSASRPVTRTQATLHHRCFMNKSKCFFEPRCLHDCMDGFLFTRGRLLTEMDFSVACLWDFSPKGKPEHFSLVAFARIVHTQLPSTIP